MFANVVLLITRVNSSPLLFGQNKLKNTWQFKIKVVYVKILTLIRFILIKSLYLCYKY